ncbi:MAG TPA: DUF5655 domain-containing protein [Vicinamibacterales bacterium]|nr:DUF5655 domain-containing protein [Vicinamibacterales bacterium]
MVKDKGAAGWRCPTCGRQFANANQSHSCRPPVPIASHFEGRPPWMRTAFDTIANKLGKSIRVDGVAKGIHLAARSTFAGITTTKTKMRVEFLLDRLVKSPRIFKVERLGPTRIAHHVELTEHGGVDAELIDWLKASRDEHAD